MTSSWRKVACMFRIKLPTKRIFRIFPTLRSDGMAPFCNLFIERPSYIYSDRYLLCQGRNVFCDVIRVRWRVRWGLRLELSVWSLGARECRFSRRRRLRDVMLLMHVKWASQSLNQLACSRSHHCSGACMCIAVRWCLKAELNSPCLYRTNFCR